MAGMTSGAETEPGERRPEKTARRSRALLTITVGQTAGRPIIALAGELDVATAPAVKTVCFETFDTHRRPYVLVDLAGLYFCDCAGLNAFLHVHKWALAGGGWVRLCRTDRRLHKVLSITGLAATLHCYPTPADALADVVADVVDIADVERSASHQREQEHS